MAVMQIERPASSEAIPDPATALFRQHETYIRSLARKTAASYLLDAEDLIQEVWLFLWQKWGEFTSRDVSDSFVRGCIRNVIRNSALAQRDQQLAQTDAFHYGTDEVAAMLPFLLDDWQSIDIPEEVREQHEALTPMCDLKSCFQNLPRQDRTLLAKKYLKGETALSSSERSRLSRALRKLTQNMNTTRAVAEREHQGTGSRIPKLSRRAADRAARAHAQASV